MTTGSSIKRFKHRGAQDLRPAERALGSFCQMPVSREHPWILLTCLAVLVISHGRGIKRAGQAQRQCLSRIRGERAIKEVVPQKRLHLSHVSRRQIRFDALGVE